MGAVEYTDCISADEQDSSYECPWYDTKQSDSEVPIMLEHYGTQSTSLLPSLQDPLWPGVVAPVRVQSMGQIELNGVYKKVKLATIVEGNPKAPFSIATTPMCRGGRYTNLNCNCLSIKMYKEVPAV